MRCRLLVEWEISLNVVVWGQDEVRRLENGQGADGTGVVLRD